MGARSVVVAVIAGIVAPLAVASPAHAAGPCDPPVVSAITCENSLPGTPQNVWSVSGTGDPAIQGFATDISIDKGSTVTFKINSIAPYHFDIYRLGWYQGNGARLWASNLAPDAPQPQTQPPCLTDMTVGLVDCGNWAPSASWQVPASAMSGVYLALLRRDDTGTESQITFVVRDDSSHSDIVVQTSDTTWEAYNTYGGCSFYLCSNPHGRAYKVSYNRPFTTVTNDSRNWWTNAEFQMWKWLERNGYDVTYTSGIDSDRNGSLLTNHKTFLSVGHDEYWSGAQRANVEAAANAGVNLAFFSGNVMYWKTRYEQSVDGSNTPYRTLVTYKESLGGAVIDPADPPTWTGLWRDTRFSPPADGGRPENALIGSMSSVICCQGAMTVPAADGKMRLWRNSPIANLAPGTTVTLTAGDLGYEWDADIDNGSRPPGLISGSTTTLNENSVIKDFGETTGPATVTHHLVEHRISSGALIFGAGTVQWSWNLMGSTTGDPPDPSAQQMTVNLLADMGAQPATPDAGLVPATASTDTTPPSSTITYPSPGAVFAQGSIITVSGTAADAGGGVVGGVEISTDNGTTWHPANGREEWTYTWIVTGNGPVTLRTRAVDDNGNIETPSAGVAITVNCPCRLFPTGIPQTPAAGDGAAVNVGLRFHADGDGYITGIRFYKGSTNTGIHTGTLWSSGGQQLATATFANESASGWQQVNFSSPVPVTANTTYVASYHTNVGHYANDPRYFFSPVDTAPLHAPASTSGSPNGVYTYGAGTLFPTSTNSATNYWVDAVFSSDATPPSVLATSPVANATAVAPLASMTATFSKPVQSSSISMVLKDSASNVISTNFSYNSGTNAATITPISSLNPLVTYTVTITGVVDTSGNPMVAPYSWSFTTVSFAVCPCSVWNNSPTPANQAANDGKSVEVGLKFRADTNGYVTGVRFYKGSTNTGTHTGTLWSSTGQQLATVTFTNESASGWQQANFASWVSITANTTYVISYHAPVGHYAANTNYFATGVDNAPLHALGNGVDGPNAVYVYSSATTFPNVSGSSANYWVDVTYAGTTAPPTVTTTSPAPNATGVGSGSPVSAQFGKPVQGTTIAMSLTDPSGANVPATFAFNTNTNTATLTPSTSLNLATTYTATVSGALDTTGIPISAPFSWSFTTSGPPTCPCSVWHPSATPATPASSDAHAVELGVKFRADVGGVITGVRFYKGTTNTGTHVGNLWTSTGTLLATATFSGESASGWQQVNFSAPVAVTPGTTYIASYHTNVGHYAATINGLASSVDAPLLHALANGADGANGVYNYSAASAFPSSSGNGTNYWVDVAFAPSPSVIARAPYPGAMGIATSSTATATFSEAVSAASIVFTVVDGSNNPVAGATTYNSGTNTATFTPSAALSPSTTYTASVSGATDGAGLAMSGPYSWSFTTVIQPPQVIATSPASGATAPSLSFPVTATWGQSVLPGSIQFTLVDQNGQSVAGAVSYDNPSKTATFTPTAPLAQLTAYTATVNATNLLGNLMVAPFSWSFSTPLGSPAVIFDDPSGDDANQVAFNAVATVTFSQAVDAATIQFTLVDASANTVAGSVTYDPLTNTATFTPSALLAASTVYTATVGGATNLTGTPMAAPFSFSFTTAPPQVFVTNRTPGSGATDVALATALTAQFSEAVTPASVSFGVRDNVNNQVNGVVTLDISNTTATFTPAANLSPSTTYTATVCCATTPGGETLNAPTTWSFTTTTPPVINAQTPTPDASNIALGTAVVAGFNRDIAPGSVAIDVVDSLANSVAGTVTLNGARTTATFTPTAPLAPSTTYTVAVSGAASSGGAVMSAPVSWSFTTTAHPTILSQTPTPGSTGIAALGTTVTAGFNQAVTGAMIVVTDPAGTALAGTTTYNGSSNVATFTPAGPFNSSMTYTVTVSGATNGGGATMLPVTWTFTTLNYGCPCTLFAPTATPAVAAASDTKAVELGVKFRADVNGFITGVRFYKGSTNTGTHVGNLWTTTGTLLATVTFTGESGSGWQQANFSTPVAVTAGTTYVISYHTNVGRYSYTSAFFANGGAMNNGPLHAPTAINGVYIYNANSAFPSTTSPSGVNYFVDAVFASAGSPTVTAMTPLNGATGVSVAPAVTARFNVPMQSTGLVFTLLDGSNNPVTATVTLDPTGTLATLTPTAPLTAGVTYTASIRARDAFGNWTVGAPSWSFST